MADAAALIDNAKLPWRLVPLCLNGDLVAEHEALDAKLAEALATAPTSLAGNTAAQQHALDIKALEELMAEHVVTFKVSALGRRRWARLVAKHPPRHDEAGLVIAADHQGVNIDEFMDEVLRLCVVEPVLDDQRWGKLIDEGLTDAQYEQLTTAVWELNRRGADVPFSHAASTILGHSAPA